MGEELKKEDEYEEVIIGWGVGMKIDMNEYKKDIRLYERVMERKNVKKEMKEEGII